MPLLWLVSGQHGLLQQLHMLAAHRKGCTQHLAFCRIGLFARCYRKWKQVGSIAGAGGLPMGGCRFRKMHLHQCLLFVLYSPPMLFASHLRYMKHRYAIHIGYGKHMRLKQGRSKMHHFEKRFGNAQVAVFCI